MEATVMQLSPITSPEPLWRRMSSDGQLIVLAQPTPKGSLVFVEPCPFCGQHHIHSGPKGGHRLTHCVPPDPDVRKCKRKERRLWQPFVALADGSTAHHERGYLLCVVARMAEVAPCTQSAN